MRRMISPVRAYSTILRATSEMAVAITVRSLPLNPALAASCRPSSLAVTISAPELTAMRTSFFTGAFPLSSLVQQGQTFFEIQCSLHFSQRQAQLHHGKRNLGLDADDRRLGATQSKNMRDGP